MNGEPLASVLREYPKHSLPPEVAATYDTLNGLKSIFVTTLIMAARALLMSRASLALENAALRQQLTVYQRNRKAPRLRGEDRSAEELAAKFGIHHSGSTVRRYIVKRRPGPRRNQTWRTFIRNHSKEVWACDFLTHYTSAFTVAYVFVIMEVSDRWLYSTLSINGLPIPYAAPNASPFVERFMRTLRREALDHFIFLSVDHVRRVVTEPIQYYNGARPSKGDKRQPWSIRGAR